MKVIKFRLCEELIEMFPLEDFVYIACIDGEKTTVYWNDDGCKEEESYSSQYVKQNLKNGVWAEIQDAS